MITTHGDVITHIQRQLGEYRRYRVQFPADRETYYWATMEELREIERTARQTRDALRKTHGLEGVSELRAEVP